MRAAVRLGLLVMTAAMLAASPAGGGQSAGERGEPRTPMIETLAPGAFDSAVAARAEVHASYRVDATVRVPLLFGSVPIADRAAVGVASFRVRDLPDPTGEAARTLRAYEFFAASDPERARGLNRLGFLREAAWIEDHVTRRTVQFGVVSSDRAGSRAEAQRGLDDGDPSRAQAVSVLDTVIGPGAARSEVVRLSVGGLWRRAGDLYEEVRPRWGAERPDEAGTLVNDPPRYDRPVGFLGALQASLRQAAAAVASGAAVRRRTSALRARQRALRSRPSRVPDRRQAGPHPPGGGAGRRRRRGASARLPHRDGAGAPEEDRVVPPLGRASRGGGRGAGRRRADPAAGLRVPAAEVPRAPGAAHPAAGRRRPCRPRRPRRPRRPSPHRCPCPSNDAAGCAPALDPRKRRAGPLPGDRAAPTRVTRAARHVDLTHDKKRRRSRLPLWVRAGSQARAATGRPVVAAGSEGDDDAGPVERLEHSGGAGRGRGRRGRDGVDHGHRRAVGGGADRGRAARPERHLAGEQRGPLGPGGPRRTAGGGDPAGGVSVRLCGGAGGARPRARCRGRRARLDRRRAGRRAHPLHAGGAGHQAGERRQLDRPRPGAEVLPAGNAACHVHALSVPGSAEHEQDPHVLPVRADRAHDPPRRGGAAARLDLHGPLGGPLGRRHPGGRRHRLQRQELVRPGRELPHRRPAPRGALHADQHRRVPLRGDHRRPERLHPAVDHRDAHLPPAGAEHDGSRIPLHRVRGGVPVRPPAEGAAGDPLGGRDDDRRHHAQDPARRRALRLVPQVRRCGTDGTGGST